MFLDNFQMAQKKCNVAKSKSDLSSMEDDIKLKKKRKIKKLQYKTHSSSESGMFYNIIFRLHIDAV